MFEEMMRKMRGGMMKPEEMPKMMEAMMEKVFSHMTTQDKIAFIENMMPRCIAMMFGEMNAEDRKEVASAMLERMATELKRHAGALRQEEG